MNEVLIGPGEELGGELYQGVAGITGDAPVESAAALVAEVDRAASAEDRRRVWLDALAAEPTPVR